MMRVRPNLHGLTTNTKNTRGENEGIAEEHVGKTQRYKGVNDETYLASITQQQTPTGEPPDLTSQTNLTLDETASSYRPVHRSNRILARKDWLDLLESHTRKSSFYERFVSGGGQLGFPHMGKVWGAKLNSQF